MNYESGEPSWRRSGKKSFGIWRTFTIASLTDAKKVRLFCCPSSVVHRWLAFSSRYVEEEVLPREEEDSAVRRTCDAVESGSRADPSENRANDRYRIETCLSNGLLQGIRRRRKSLSVNSTAMTSLSSIFSGKWHAIITIFKKFAIRLNKWNCDWPPISK